MLYVPIQTAMINNLVNIRKGGATNLKVGVNDFEGGGGQYFKTTKIQKTMGVHDSPPIPGSMVAPPLHILSI